MLVPDVMADEVGKTDSAGVLGPRLLAQSGKDALISEAMSSSCLSTAALSVAGSMPKLRFRPGSVPRQGCREGAFSPKAEAAP
jgi:hypothetical protein